MRYLLTSLIAVLFFGCTTHKTVKFSAGKNKYFLDVPAGFKSLRYDGDDFIELRLHYPDSSTIYITNDYRSGGGLYYAKEKQYGNGVNLMIVLNDTLELNGIYASKYWREMKANDVIIGYTNVSDQIKWEYDEALATLGKKRN